MNKYSLGISIVCAVIWVISIIFNRDFMKYMIRKSIAKLSDRITLIPLKQAPWKNAAAAGSLTEELEKLGFVREGDFTIREMPGIIISGFAHISLSLWASVYEHPQGLHWIEIKGEYKDGTSVYSTNAPKGGEMDSLPGFIKIYDKDASAVILLERLQKEGPVVDLIPVIPGAFKENFEAGWAKWVKARKSQAVSAAEADRYVKKHLNKKSN